MRPFTGVLVSAPGPRVCVRGPRPACDARHPIRQGARNVRCWTSMRPPARRIYQWSSGFMVEAGRRATRAWWLSSRRPQRRRASSSCPSTIACCDRGDGGRRARRRRCAGLGAQRRRVARRRPRTAAGDKTSSGGQLAALMCTDDLLRESGRRPADGDQGVRPGWTRSTFPQSSKWRKRRARAPATADQRPSPEVPATTPAERRDFSAVTHVAKGKGIAPFLILHIGGNPDAHGPGTTLCQCARGGRDPAKVVAGERRPRPASTTISARQTIPLRKELFAFVAASLGR